MKKHIILIDDDEDELQIFFDALKEIPQETFKCTYASGSEQAIEMLKYLDPDFIFVDFNLPKLNGLQLLSIIKNDPKVRHAEVYLYSTSISERVNKMAILIGASGCIEKPNTTHLLAQALKKILMPEGTLQPYAFSIGK